jgi:hypothetical protein
MSSVLLHHLTFQVTALPGHPVQIKNKSQSLFAQPWKVHGEITVKPCTKIMGNANFL